MGEREEVIGIDLEQLFARIGLQHVDQRLAVVAVRIVAAAIQRSGDLAAQNRDNIHGGDLERARRWR